RPNGPSKARCTCSTAQTPQVRRLLDAVRQRFRALRQCDFTRHVFRPAIGVHHCTRQDRHSQHTTRHKTKTLPRGRNKNGKFGGLCVMV
ncbi:hypothetical protein N9D59_07590, partial [Burkholderiaceae bacterium]|nr:hypothetical protein [Burkholderiaceae bacterium]